MKKLSLILLAILLGFGFAACKDDCTHVYDNACDVTCNECGEERAITHTPEEDDGDCTTEIVCSVCESVTTSAKAHDFTGEWQQAEDGHYHICDNDGCKKTDEIVAHSGEGICEVCGFVYGTTLHPEGTSSLSIPNVFEQANHADASIVNEYNKYLFGETVTEDGVEKVVYKSVPALITLKISNRSNKEVTLNSVKLRLVDDDGTVYPIASREVSVQKNENGIELVYSGTYDEISVTIGKDMEDGEMFDAYMLALPLPDDNAFEGKKIEFIVETSECELVVFVLDSKQLAAVNSNNAFNWFAGKQYTIRIGTACRDNCSFDENGVCTVCGAVCAHIANVDDGDCTTAITCRDCGTVLIEAEENHTPNADDGNCLTAITCSDCGTVTTPARDNHTYTYTDNGDGTHTHNGVCSFCDNVTESATESHAFDSTDGKCDCGVDMDYNATVTDGVRTYYANGETTLNQAVTAILESGSRTFTVDLPADAPAEMFTAIRRAIRDTEGVADGSINLTLGGVTTIPDHSEFASEGSVIFGSVIQDENGESLAEPDEVTQLASVNLPDVTYIGKRAFYFCGNLTSVITPKVQTIGQQAFGYTALTSVEFPELTTIPYAMFAGTWTLTSAKFPKVTTIEQYGLLIGAGFALEAFPLELTAEGDITIGANAFNGGSLDYSGKVDLVLHSNKSGEVNGLTWKGYTFKSIEFLCTDGTTNHTYGAAVNNGDGTHTYTCTTCNLTKVESCHGEATCKELATCEECGVQFGELSDHILDHATGYCKFGCETWMATFKIEAEGNTTYYKDMDDFTNQELADGSVVTLLTDEKDFGWGVGGDYTLDLNGYDLTVPTYSLYAGLAGESETSEISIANSADERSSVPYIRVNNCTLKIGGKVDVAKMILFYTTCTVDLTNADFSSCELNLNLDGCNTSQFVLGNYAIYDASGNVVTGELTKGVTYIIKAAQ